MKARPDLLVVGGGPAGAALAALAAGRGARVTLIERARFPREKVCGEFLSAEGCAVLDRLGLLAGLVARGGVWMDACRLSGLDGTALDAALPELGDAGRAGLGISRGLLDATLLDHALRAGVEVLERHEAVEPLLEHGRVAGFLVRPADRSGPEAASRARVVVAADGRRSLLAGRLRPGRCDPRRATARSWYALKTHLDVDPRRLDGRVELHLFDGGYAGLGGIEGGRTNLCLLVRLGALRACAGSPARLLRERILANPTLRGTLGDAPPCGRWLGIGPLRWGARAPATGGALLLGDAAGTIDPFSGEGMSNALRSAEIALPHVLAAVARGGLDRTIERAYAGDWRAAFGPVTRRVRRLGRLLERPRLAAPVVRVLRGAGGPWIGRLVAATRTGA